jgi:post-segregation antitoxin (ccd killing protein)
MGRARIERKEVNEMRVLKRKDMLTKTITVRVTSRVKAEFEQLRERADAAGFDVGATLRETISDTARQIRHELDAIDRKTGMQSVESIVNGFDHANAGSSRAKL